MGKKPARKKCKYGCGLIPVDLFADHLYVHEAQTSLITDDELQKITVAVEPKRPRRKARVGA